MIASFRSSRVSEIQSMLAAANPAWSAVPTISSLTVLRLILCVLALTLASRCRLPMHGVLVSRGHFLIGPPTSLRMAGLLTVACDLACGQGA